MMTEVRLANDIAKWTFQVADEKDEKKYHIKGTLKKEDQFFSGKLDSSKLVMNYDSWNLPPDHEFKMSNDTVIFNDLSLRRGEQVFSLTKTAGRPENEGTKINFTAFNLENFTNLLTTENVVEAELNGDWIIKTVNIYYHSPYIEAGFSQILIRNM